MMKRILACLLSLLTVFTLVACDLQYTDKNAQTSGGFTSDGGDSTGGADDGSTSGDPTQEAQVEYVVRLTNAGAPYVDTDGVKAQWTNGFDYFQADFVNGVAKTKGLDGDYTVSLIGLNDKYAYNPNGNRTSSLTPEIEIPVYRIMTARGGSGEDAYDCLKCRYVDTVYRTEVLSKDQVVFYEFEPTENGEYVIESWVDASEGKINPKLDVYYGTIAAKYYGYTLDEGGYSKGYTRNFKHTINVDDSNIGGVWTFAVHAEAKNDEYPANVEFMLKRADSYTADRTQSEWKLPADLYGLMGAYMLELQAMDEQTFLQTTIDIVYNNISTALAPSEIMKELAEEYVVLQQLTLEDYSSPDAIQNALEYKIEDCDLTYDDKGKPIREIDCYIRTYLVAKVRAYFDSLQNSGTLVGAEQYYTPEGSNTSILAFRGENYRLSPNTGVYHLYDETKYASDPYGFGAGFGPVLYGKITSPIRFIGDGADGGEALTVIEYHGNKALTVSNGTENYKLFIEGFYNINVQANQPIDASGQLQGMPVGFPDLYKQALGYADFVNGDGLVPVTPELKEFIQKFSVSQRLFNDGNGYAEVYASPSVDALEEDQWLFACCYYQD